MDGLALLCNLHADGPLSLRRLRRAGVRTLDQLTGVPPASLVGLLRASPSQVGRFRHEAGLLRERLREAELEPEYPRQPSGPGELRRPLAAPTLGRPQAFDLEPTAAERGDAPALSPLPTPMPAPAREPPSARPEPPPVPSRAAPEAPSVGREHTPTPAAPPIEGTVLRAGEVEGLDARTCERLVREGVRTYRSLIDLAGLSLARRSSIPYTRLLDLRYHARDFLARRFVGPGSILGTKTASTTPPASRERVVELQPAARAASSATPRASSRATSPGSYRGSRVFEGARLEPRVSHVHEEPGVAGPFV